ncbi:hypothetical protein BU23DRAFT_53631 [Bimuria novae-zelandiae CBS 107.79]|uniref:Uncharacterized protein n=1 Tax=Bimuria novae-zelandiae CBS 107.79 TaxID=1447943 RepID=A0A6A5ULF4_9PLEO|nr:hypothetical protein BU23DRAFT_53631 [Bimuria novae-zelandiae CBS 107.79]
MFWGCTWREDPAAEDYRRSDADQSEAVATTPKPFDTCTPSSCHDSHLVPRNSFPFTHIPSIFRLVKVRKQPVAASLGHLETRRAKGSRASRNAVPPGPPPAPMPSSREDCYRPFGDCLGLIAAVGMTVRSMSCKRLRTVRGDTRLPSETHHQTSSGTSPWRTPALMPVVTHRVVNLISLGAARELNM